MLTNEQIDDIIDELLGSNLTLDDVLESQGLDYALLEPEDITNIENVVFFCDECENWHLIVDLGENEIDICRWCAEDLNEGMEYDEED